MSGNRTGTFEYSQSTALYMPYAPKRTAGISGGASLEVVGEVPEEPTCRHKTVPVSAHAANSRIPVAGVDRRQAELVRCFGER
jgi:hypothetical protein